MFGWMKKKPGKQAESDKGESGQRITFSIKGMHCTSCALVIDDALEEVPGIISSKTEYSRSQVQVEYDASVVTKAQMLAAIAAQGYQATAV